MLEIIAVFVSHGPWLDSSILYDPVPLLRSAGSRQDMFVPRMMGHPAIVDLHPWT